MFDFPALSKWLQFEILITISTEDFPSFSTINKETFQLCSGKLSNEQKLFYGDQIADRLYQERSKLFFSENEYNLKEEENMSWREFYFRVLTVNYNSGIYKCKYAKEGKLLELKLITMKCPDNIDYIYSMFMQASLNGHLNIIQYLSNKFNFYFNQYKTAILHKAASSGQLEILKWAKENNLIEKSFNLATSAAYTKQIDILNWLRDNYNDLPKQEAIDFHIKINCLEMIDWYSLNIYSK